MGPPAPGPWSLFVRPAEESAIASRLVRYLTCRAGPPRVPWTVTSTCVSHTCVASKCRVGFNLGFLKRVFSAARSIRRRADRARIRLLGCLARPNGPATIGCDSRRSLARPLLSLAAIGGVCFWGTVGIPLQQCSCQNTDDSEGGVVVP